MELIIQKSTELGVSLVVPVICERTVVKLDERKAGDRLARWQKVAEEAAKQSRRTYIPEVTMPVTLKTALSQLTAGVLAILPWEEEPAAGIGQVLRSGRGNSRDVAVFIGPEGGFSGEEVSLAISKGVSVVSLGPRIMRTETAGIAAVALVLYELGDLGGAAHG